MLLCCALQLMLCGCGPAFYTYWAPRTEGGNLLYIPRGQYAPSNSVEFIFDDVKVDFTGLGTTVVMALHIPEGKSVAFTSDKVDAYIPENKQVVFDVRGYSAMPGGGDHFNPTVSLQLIYYISQIVISDSEKTVYKIKMPNIIVNGKSYTIPEIEFTKAKGFGIFG